MKMTRRDDIELFPYKYAGKEHRIFLTPFYLFRASVKGKTLIEHSREELEQKIATLAGSNDGTLLFFPIIRIDADSDDGFGLTRGWFAENPNDKTIYSCGWHVPPETRMDVMTPDPHGLPVSINELPFIDTADEGWVYYGLFQERLWMAFMKLDVRFRYTLTRNKNSMLNNIPELGTLPPHNELCDKLYEEILTP